MLKEKEEKSDQGHPLREKMSVTSWNFMNDHYIDARFDTDQRFMTIGGGSSISEIEEEIIIDDTDSSTNDDHSRRIRLESIREDYFEGSSATVSINGEDNVYVAVGKTDSSMDALSWTLRHSIHSPRTTVVLVHVFPETHFIPYPLGRMPKNQASPEQVESYMAQERGKRRELLQKFIDACSKSKVKVETLLIESDMVAKAILDLIPILNIRRLVLGASKSHARKLRPRRGNGIPEQILRSRAIDTCDVKIISEGKEVMIEQMMESPRASASASASDGGDNSSRSPQEELLPSESPRRKDQTLDPFACICFNKPKADY